MNKKWKLAFTRRPAFPFRSFVEGVAGKKEKSKGRKEFNIKKLSFCVDMKIPRISASIPRRLFSSLLPPYLLRVYRGSPRLFHLRVLIFMAADSLPGDLIVWQDAANRQIRLKDIDLATRARNVFVRLQRALIFIASRWIVK